MDHLVLLRRASRTACAAATLALMPLGTPAQSASARADPMQAQAATPPLIYRSALAGYRRFDAESPVLGWREANELVERIGGWRAYAREANAPEPAASAPVPASPPASAPRASRPAPPAPAHRH